MRALALGMIAVAATAIGCGDQAKSCGDGTVLQNGTCVPTPSTGTICGDGTVLDELTNECVPDPSVCGNGTVLIDGHCVDPNTDVTIDVEEGPEPNGFEPGATPAGTIQLKDTGSTIVHGCIKPLDNNNPDLDVFLVTVGGPTLIKVTADGVQDLAAGFLVFGDDARLGTWFRLGLNVTTDTSKRELFLPVAGRYEIIMSDTRTLLPITTSGQIVPGAGFPAAGNPDGTSCYFVTITKEAIPTPAALDLVAGASGTIGEDLKFFTAPFPEGLVAMHGVIDPEDIDHDGFPDLDSRAAASLILVNNNNLRQINDAGGGVFPADGPDTQMFFGGVKPTDTPLVVLDYVWNITAFPADFQIDIISKTDSQALATDGSAVTATSNSPTFDGDPANFGDLNFFHFDVTTAGEIDGMNITFNKPVTGVLIDQDTLFVSTFTNLIPTKTFTNYRGLIRTPAPGRYYFAILDPNDPAGTLFTVTSTITPQTPGTITLDTPTAQVDLEPTFRSNVFTYAAGAEPWQLFDATSTVGDLDLEMIDPNVTDPSAPGFGFGRLDKLAVTDTASGSSVSPSDVNSIFGGNLDQAGTTPIPRILKNPIAGLPQATTNFLAHFSPAFGSTASGTFSASFATRVYEDFGGAPLVAGDSKTVNSSIAAAGNQQRFYFETEPGNLLTIKITPSGGLDAVLELLNIDETVAGTVDLGGANAIEQTTQPMGGGGFVAFRVRGKGATTGAFTVKVDIAASGYTYAVGAATFSNACIGGQAVLLSDDGSGFNVPSDEGLSATIAAPTGFELFGVAVTNLRVSSNGFLTLNPTISDARFTHGPLSGDTDISIAPFWTDLENVSVCMRASGTTLTIQWIGDDFTAFPGTTNVQFQVTMDGSESLIQFVYGPSHLVNGSAATVGLGGTSQVQVGFDQAVISPNTAITFEPN